MHEIKTASSSSAFDSIFERPTHSYATRFSNAAYVKPTVRLKSSFRISIRNPTICNKFTGKTEKELESISLIKARVDSKLLELVDEITLI